MADEIEGWDSEMDALVRWLNAWSCPEPPFEIGPALKVVDRELFLKELHHHIDRCSERKDEIPHVRLRLRRLKAAMETEQNTIKD
jgi:hypothetical protein